MPKIITAVKIRQKTNDRETIAKQSYRPFDLFLTAIIAKIAKESNPQARASMNMKAPTATASPCYAKTSYVLLCLNSMARTTKLRAAITITEDRPRATFSEKLFINN